MTDLTEKWKAGELTQWRFYYVLYSGGIEPLLLNGENNFKNHSKIVNPLIKEVLAPVPSYEELQVLKEENARLKGLLKDCKGRIAELLDNYSVLDKDLSFEHGYNWSEKEFKQENKDVYELLTKIEEALK